MAGVEAVIGGASVSAIIKEVVKTGRSYCAGKYKEHKDTQEMLDNLEASLPLILAAIELAEQETIALGANLREWLRQLKDVTHEAEDVMDDFEANRIRDSLKNKGKVSELATSSARAVKSLFLSDQDEKNLKNLIRKINILCKTIGDFTKMIESHNKNPSVASIGSSNRETSSYLPKNKKIFGREKEIELVLDMIINYHKTQPYVSNYRSKSGENVSKERTDQSDIAVEHGTPQVSLKDPGLVENVSRHEDPSLSKETPTPIHDTQKSQASEEEVAQIKSIHHGSSVPDVSNPAQSSKIKSLSSVTQKHLFRSHAHQTRLQANISFSVGNRPIGVLPIVGIGGVGKTTIAQVIHNNPEVNEHFELQGWVYVVDSTNHIKIVHDILHSFKAGSSKSIVSIDSLNDGYLRLKHAIYQKKFLIIFDDVREGRTGIDATWYKLLEVLGEGAGGSIVIVTTETKGVADAIGTLPPIFLDVLHRNDILALLEYHALDHIKYHNEKNSQYFPLTNYEKAVLRPIGEQIAEKLGGLPLAAEVVGTLLRIKPDKNHWEKILESNWWDLENTSQKILSSLGASFRNIDPDLKQCFLYCSLFPKNYVFEKDRLVQMWIAHGFIHPTEAENMKLETNELKIEDIGRSKFDKLVDMFFFQTTVLKNRYVMHDLIREFAIATSLEMLYASSNYLIDNKTIPSFVRHLSIDPNIVDDIYVDHIQWNNKNIKSLRTIMFFGFCKTKKDKGLQSILDKLGGLRLLDLSYFIFLRKDLSYLRLSRTVLSDFVVGQLSHLRFLDLSFSGIIEVPNSLCQLVHLQVLDMRGCQFFKLPNDMNKLVNLRHLYASPKTTSLIRGIGSLTNLQELEEFQVKKKEGFTISELKDLNSLQGQLTLKFLHEVPSKEMAIRAALGDKKCLTSLIFYMSYRHSKDDDILEMLFDCVTEECVKHVEVLEGLKPHSNIRELKILRFQWNTFPSWILNIHEMNNLRSIELSYSMYVESLPPLGSLPKLEVLILEKLKSIICIGEEFYGSSDVIFPSLKELAFSGLCKWRHWLHTGERQLLPCLEKLKITNCTELSEAPLDCLSSSLVELHLSRCDRVTKNIGMYLANMTSLRELYLEASQSGNIDLCCDNLGELRVVTLENIVIFPQIEGQSCSLVNLKKLCFQSWGRIDRFERPPIQSALQEEHMHCLPSLTSIEVRHCFELPDIPLYLVSIPFLQTLLIDCHRRFDLHKFTSEEENWLRGLTSLEEMELSRCDLLEHLPTSLSTLPSLKKFTLRACPNIHSLPQEGLPKGLKELFIIDCSMELMLRCKPNTGEEWSKISHIPYIRVHI